MTYILLFMAVLSVIYVGKTMAEDHGGYMEGAATAIAIFAMISLNGMAWLIYGLTKWLG